MTSGTWTVRREEPPSSSGAEIVTYEGSDPPYGLLVNGLPLVRGTRWSAVWALCISAAATVLLLGSAVALMVFLESRNGRSGPAGALSLMFVAAAVALVLSLCALAIVLKRLGLHDPTRAMGLPPGSVRAVIALMLVLLFFIAAIFLFTSTRDVPIASEQRVLTGITAERLAAIPSDQLVASAPSEDGDTFDVTLRSLSGGTTTSDDLAKQLVTTLGTLVTAVAAFYFGSNSVSTARNRSDGGTPGGSRSDRVTSLGIAPVGAAPPDPVPGTAVVLDPVITPAPVAEPASRADDLDEPGRSRP